jgi:hypothetical protein
MQFKLTFLPGIGIVMEKFDSLFPTIFFSDSSLQITI